MVTMLEKVEKLKKKRIYLRLIYGSIKSLWYNQWQSFAGEAAYIWFLYECTKSNVYLCYFKNGKQRVKVNNNFSAAKPVIAGVRQGSIDESISFNLLINDLVLFLTETMWSNYADDNNLFSTGKDW